jgi:hypothetical protein
MHLWNPVGFPYIHIDEAHYMGRALHVLNGLGVQEFDRYDHPYFGHLFLAGIFKIIGYPDSLNPTDSIDLHSIEMLHMIPRLLVGALAVIDTLLVYKIAERYYDRKIALIASLLFSVMPLTWLTRWIMLDSIQLPFILSSVLFAIYSKDIKAKNYNSIPSNTSKRAVMLTLASGVFLGLAIFTKIPAFAFIPVLSFLVFTANNRKWKSLLLWFIPVVLIPIVWPAYALSHGEFDKWLDGIVWQATERPDKPLLDAMLSLFFNVDPILLILAAVGLAFAAAKRDFFVLLWAVPYLTFLQIIGFVSVFHLITLVPVFCILASKVLVDVSNGSVFTSRRELLKQMLPYTTVTGITLIGLMITAMMINTNIASGRLEAITFVTKYLVTYETSNNDKIQGHSVDKKPIVIGRPEYFWIPKYIFDKSDKYEFKTAFATLKERSQEAMLTKTQEVFLIVDQSFMRILLENSEKAERLRTVYDGSKTIAQHTLDADNYMDIFKNHYFITDTYEEKISKAMNDHRINPNRIEIKANY